MQYPERNVCDGVDGFRNLQFFIDDLWKKGPHMMSHMKVI